MARSCDCLLSKTPNTAEPLPVNTELRAPALNKAAFALMISGSNSSTTASKSFFRASGSEVSGIACDCELERIVFEFEVVKECKLSALYARALEMSGFGFNTKRKFRGASSSAVNAVPVPVACARPPQKKNGTSDPK